MTVFAHPAWALVTLLIGGLAIWSFQHEWMRRTAARAALGTSALLARLGVGRGDMRLRRTAMLRIAAIVCVGLALARPQWGSVDGNLGRSGRDVLVLLDLSRSMLADDAGGTRLDRAKKMVRGIVDASPGDRVGLVIFGGAAFLQLPLTADHATFGRFLDAANPSNLDDLSTNIASAVHLAVTTFKHGSDTGPRAILLASDGERSDGSFDPVVEELRLSKIPIFVLGIGTREGGLLPADSTVKTDSASKWHVDDIGRPVQSRLDEVSLRRLVDASPGAYALWSDKRDVASLTRSIQQLPTRVGKAQHIVERGERFQWPLGFAVLFLCLEVLLGLPPRRGASAGGATATATRIGSAVAIMLVMFAMGCGTRGAMLRSAVNAYDHEKWADALAGFQKANVQLPEAAVRYNMGNAQMRMNHYVEAIQSYRDVPAQDESLRMSALFNMGNAYVRASEAAPEAQQADMLDRGIRAYEDVLAANPADASARWNLEVALRKRGEIQTSGSAGAGGRAQAGRSQGSQNGLTPDREKAVGAMAGGGQGDAQGESAEQLDENRARELLEQIEKQQLENHEGRPAPHGTRGDHDW